MDIFYISVIFLLSILMQLISVVLALRLIKTTGYFRVWLALAIAVTLMAIRRIISFYDLLYFHDVKSVNVTAELVALLISAVICKSMMRSLPLIINEPLIFFAYYRKRLPMYTGMPTLQVCMFCYKLTKNI